MKRKYQVAYLVKRFFGAMLALTLMLSVFPTLAKATCTLSNLDPVVTTGDPAADIVSAASAQIGKTGAQLGATENWCADFVFSCARLVGIGEDVIPTTGGVTAMYNGILNAGGQVVSQPQAGDLVFYSPANNTHVAIMINSIDSIHGNVNGDINGNFYATSRVTKCKYTEYLGNYQYVFVRPKYTSTPVQPITTPDAPTVSVSGSTVTFTWNPVSWTNQYRINVKNAGGAILNEWANVTSNSNPIQYTISNVADGSYYAYITAYNSSESRQSGGSAFTVSTQPTTYTVTLNTDGGTINSGNVTSYTYGIGATLPTNVTKTGYTFLGWFDGSTKVTAIGTTDTGNKSYTAKWQANTYNVTLNPDGGTINAGNVTSYTYGIGATLPTNVTKTGYTFLGWFDGNTKVTAIGTTDTGNKSYTAKWQANTYNVTLNPDGGTINAGNVTSYTYGVGATLPTDVTKTGYTFLGWYDGDTKVTAISTTDIGTKTYLARWEANDSPVAVYAIVDGVTETQPIATVVPKYDAAVLPELNKLPAAMLDRYGYDRAAGFFAANGDTIDANTLAQTYDKVYVRYTSKLFTVTFRTDGGSSVGAQQVRYRKTASRPADPTRDGYIFKGWLDEAGHSFSFSTPITQNRILTAKWEVDGRLLELAGLLGSEKVLPFYDVSSNDWFYDAVKSAWENELIDGVTARYFKPNSTLTVAQAIKLAAALHQKQSVGFVTLQNGGTHWYDNYVNYAVTNNLIEAAYQNKSAETMNAPVTRAEFVHILAKLLNAGTINTVNSIPDVKSGDAYADEIFAFYRAGILTGSDRLGTFHPESSLKRSEAAAILVRLYDATQRQYITLR